jgi:hypothetical protein
VQFLPAFALLLAVFLSMPFALPAYLQPSAVDDHADRPLGRTIDLPPNFHRGIASR